MYADEREQDIWIALELGVTVVPEAQWACDHASR